MPLNACLNARSIQKSIGCKVNTKISLDKMSICFVTSDCFLWLASAVSASFTGKRGLMPIFKVLLTSGSW